jgi:myotubularin-related protein 10/11/12
MPILEIRNGGFTQIDLYNRMILNNIHKMQRALETGNFGDLQKDDETKAEMMEGSNGKHQQHANRIPVTNSFFPFSINDNDDNDANHDALNEILTCSSDAFLEGSVFDFD